MLKTNSNDKSVASLSGSYFFSEENVQTNKVKPLYLFCTEEGNDKLFFFISDADSPCWLKKANVWENLEIEDSQLPRGLGPRIYYFKQNDHNFVKLNIPYPFKNNAKYTCLNDKAVILTTIPLSQDVLNGHNITGLEDLDLESIPKTLELAKKKQAVKEKIQEVEGVISLMKQLSEKIQKLEPSKEKFIQTLSNEIGNFEKTKSDLLLENSPETIAHTLGGMRI